MVRSIHIALTALLLCGVTVVNRCTLGTGSETTNSAVVGVIYQSDGKTRAAGAFVAIRPEETLADTSGILSKTATKTAAVTTDDTGGFFFDATLDTGVYVIEAEDDDNNRALIEPVRISYASSPEKVTMTLLPAGVITGTVRLLQGGDPRNVFVCAFGINRFTMPDTGGQFTFDSLAEAVYDLRIITAFDDYAVLDTFGITVRSGEVTDLDTLLPSFTGIPVPAGLSLSYDTLKRIVALSWEKSDTLLVNGYKVYRRCSDSEFVTVATLPVTDTCYCDSSVLQDKTYGYRITAIDGDDNEGDYSSGANVTATGAFELVSVIGTSGGGVGPFEAPRGITGDADRVYIADYNLGKIEKYDYQGTRIGGISTSFKPFNIFLSRNNNIIVCTFANREPHLILRIDTSGVIIDTFDICDDINEPYDICQNGNGDFIVANRASNKVVIFDEGGDYLTSLGGQGSGEGFFNDMYGVAVDDSGSIYVTDGGNNRIQKFTGDGTLAAVWGCAGTAVGAFSRPSDMAFDGNGNLYIMELSGRRVQKFTANGIVIERFGIGGDAAGQFGDNLNCMWIDSGGRIWISEGANSYRVQIFNPR